MCSHFTHHRCASLPLLHSNLCIPYKPQPTRSSEFHLSLLPHPLLSHQILCQTFSLAIFHLYHDFPSPFPRIPSLSVKLLPIPTPSYRHCFSWIPFHHKPLLPLLSKTILSTSHNIFKLTRHLWSPLSLLSVPIQILCGLLRNFKHASGGTNRRLSVKKKRLANGSGKLKTASKSSCALYLHSTRPSCIQLGCYLRQTSPRALPSIWKNWLGFSSQHPNVSSLWAFLYL